MNLPDVFHDSLRDVPLRLKGLHRPSRLLHEILETRELGEHVIDHGFLLADAVERNPDVAEEVHDRVGLALNIVDELTTALDRHDFFLCRHETVAQAVQLARGAGDLGAAFGDRRQVRLAFLSERVDSFDPAADGLDHLFSLRDSLNLAVHLVG